MLAAEVGCLRARLLLLQHCNNLLFRESSILHSSVVDAPDSNPFWTKFSVAVTLIPTGYGSACCGLISRQFLARRVDATHGTKCDQATALKILLRLDQLFHQCFQFSSYVVAVVLMLAIAKEFAAPPA